MSKAIKPPVDRAAARIRKLKRTDAEKVSVTQTISQAMTNSADWASATDVQAAVKPWVQDAEAIDANAKVIAHLRATLKTADAKQLGLRQNWVVSTAHLLSTVTVFCNGSAEKIAGFALDIGTRTKLGTLGEIAGLGVNPGKAGGTVTASWARGNARHGFVVQHASDPGNPATFSAAMPWTKSKFTLGGLSPNANVSVRVAAIDPTSPTGQGPWTAWVVGNAK